MWKVTTTEDEARKIADLMGANFVGMCRIDGLPIIYMKNQSGFEFYHRWLRLQIIEFTMVEDHLPNFSSSSVGSNSLLTVKISEHDTDIFKNILREKKLKRILGND